MLHPKVKEYIFESGEKEFLLYHIKQLSDDPYNKRAEADIKKLKGKKHTLYRLRIGIHRFEYFIDNDKIWIDNAFKRERGYR